MKLLKLLPALSFALITGCSSYQVYTEDTLYAPFVEKLKEGALRSDIDAVKQPTNVQRGKDGAVCGEYRFNNKERVAAIIFIGGKLESWRIGLDCVSQLRVSGYSKEDEDTQKFIIKKR